ncbi:MAG TPA: class I SAM-dependent methyltransferase [Acidimicrobiales bacterium]|nr:class I SAM-dependent methyltransferase [Acidimicrobiales bacterium]
MPMTDERYPEMAAGGFSRIDGTVEFYSRVTALLRPEMTVLDFGAGRGAAAEDPVPFRRELQALRGRVARVVGADIDPVVVDNPGVDEAVVLQGAGTALPLADQSVDLILADFVFEHLEDPAFAARELTRVLRPGGWVCARTPNRWGYIGLGARLVPNSQHGRVLERLQPGRKDEDVFPTRYRLNTRAAIRECFPPDVFEDHSYGFDSEPAYTGGSRLGARAVEVLMRVAPERFASMWMVFLRKREP